MKKITTTICIALVIIFQLFFPYASYAEEENRIRKNEENLINESINNESINDENITNEEILKQENKEVQEEKKEENTENELEVKNTELEEKIETVNGIDETIQLEEGIYKIVLATAPTQSLTVDGGRTNDGANIHVWEYCRCETTTI